MKKIFFQNLLLLAALVVSFGSCQKELSGTNNPAEADLGTKVRSNVSGFVTDENDAPVQGAAVKVGGQTITTDEYGYFEAGNAEVTKNAATVTVNKAGYFPGIRTYIAAANKAAFVRIKLLPKDNAGVINAATGGEVTLSNGLKIGLPANAVVNAASGTAYTGTVNVAAKWLDPTAADIDRIMPGDRRAIDENNTMKMLVTYGMAAVELTNGSGEKLQVAPGKKAKLTMPLPASIADAAPASIPLWHFDEAIGLWKEEGSAVKTGNTYEGEVSHFSFWNCDVPNNYVQLNLTLKDEGGNPVQYAYVKVTNTSDNTWATGITDATGYVQGAVPSNSQLLLEVFPAYNCGTAMHTQNVTTAGSNVSLGTITVDNTSSSATISGTVTNCSGLPVTDGAVIVKMNNGWFNRYPLSNTGAFNISTILCNGSINADIIAEDNAAGQQSALTTHTINTGSNALGNIQACGISANQFVNITINGTTHSFTAPADSVAYYNNNQTMSHVNAFRMAGTGASNSFNIIFNNTGLGVGSSQAVIELNTSYIGSATITPGTVVTITEYGAIGEFISGSFTTTATGTAPPNTVYTITGNFRLRRYN